jgi:hypothetical protein
MMERETGIPDFPLWLIGDTNPVRWQDRLMTPFDPRHPARHSIWTPILDVIQDRVYRGAGLRVDTACVHVRNALADPVQKPDQSERQWGSAIDGAVSDLRRLIHAHRPVMLLSFGGFAFEFVRRAIGETGWHSRDYWSAGRLGREFSGRIRDFEPGMINLLPLLHRGVSGRHFLEAQEYFCGRKGIDYFEAVGRQLADTMLQYRNQLPIWIGFEAFIRRVPAPAETCG